MLNPSTIVVHIHDTIETAGLGDTKEDAAQLRERVQAIISAPVDEAMRRRRDG